MTTVRKINVSQIEGRGLGDIVNNEHPEGTLALYERESDSARALWSLRLPDGGLIEENVVTDNPTIDLIPAGPDAPSQKLVIKGGGQYNAFENGINLNYYVNTAAVGDTLTFYVYAESYANQTLYWWAHPAEALAADPNSGTVELNSGGNGQISFVLDSDDYEFTVRVSPTENVYNSQTTGVESGLINSDSATYGDGHHLHLTTGDLEETSIFLGTDDHNVRTTTNGSIQITTPNTTNKVWEFDTDGSMTFPDGSVQTTAFTGETISNFVAVNNNGTISGSSNGTDWNDYDSNLTGVSYVAVGPNKIVYVAHSSNNNTLQSLWYADSYNSAPVEVTSISPREYDQVKYFKSISKFVAVGGEPGEGIAPCMLYSSDGENWTEVFVNQTFLGTLESYDYSSKFSDIEENSTGFLIVSDDVNLGGFFISNITDELNGDTHVNLGQGNIERVLWVDRSNFGFRGWHIFDNDNEANWYYNENTNPQSGTFEAFTITNAGEVLAEEVGYAADISEIVMGEYDGVSTVVIATTNGQIIYWPAVPAGPFVSIPKPYTTTITGITSANPAVLSYTQGEGSHNNGEKIIITNCGDFNGTYYINSSNELFTDIERTTSFNATGLTYTSGGTLTFSSGTFIDALHYSNGIFYAGNDDEEVFVSTNGGETWSQVDTLSAGEDGEEVYLNDIDSYVSIGNVNTGEFSFNSNTVTVADKDMQFRTTRAGFDVDCDFDVEAADDVHIDALGDTVSIAAANEVTITTNTSNMYPIVWLGNEEDFIGTWNGFDLTVVAPNSDTTLITLLDHYVETDAPIWIRTASGYVETDTPNVATKTVGLSTTEFVLPLTITSPSANADVISMKLYDSINTSGEKEFVFTKDGKLIFPDSTVQTTAYTGINTSVSRPSTTGIPDAFSISIANASNLTPGMYTNLLVGFTNKNVTLDIFINESYNITIGNVRNASPATFIVGDSAVLNGNLFGGTTPGDNITITVSSLKNVAIDLTKSINKLTDGSYDLADGVEGQIMYLVRSPETISENVFVQVENGDGSNPLQPFRTNLGFANVDNTGICTLIFTDGTWKQTGGNWD